MWMCKTDAAQRFVRGADGPIRRSLAGGKGARIQWGKHTTGRDIKHQNTWQSGFMSPEVSAKCPRRQSSVSTGACACFPPLSHPCWFWRNVILRKIKFNQESDMRGIWELSLVMNASSHCGGGWRGGGWWCWSRCFVSVWMIDVSAWREDALKVEMKGSVLTGSDGGILVPQCLNLLLQRFSPSF